MAPAVYPEGSPRAQQKMTFCKKKTVVILLHTMPTSPGSDIVSSFLCAARAAWFPLRPVVPAGRDIYWAFPVLTAGAPVTLEFVIDLCDYCDKYSERRRFNPIDSFHFR